MTEAVGKPLTVRYFAWLREMVGVSTETLHVPPEVTTAGALMDWLATRSAGHAAALTRRDVVRCAVNQEFADAATPVGPGDEIAFFPPVTGG